MKGRWLSEEIIEMEGVRVCQQEFCVDPGIHLTCDIYHGRSIDPKIWKIKGPCTGKCNKFIWDVEDLQELPEEISGMVQEYLSTGVAKPVTVYRPSLFSVLFGYK